MSDFEFESKPRVLIVEARFYEDISDQLLAGAKAVLEQNGVDYEVMQVPGALEIPAMLKYAIRGLSFDISRRRFDAYVALACVIRGETTHYELVSEQSTAGLVTLSYQYSLAVGNGILTVENKKQAEERANPAKKNLGGQAAEVALKMLMNKQEFGLFPRRSKR